MISNSQRTNSPRKRVEIKCPWETSTDITNPSFAALRGILATSFRVLSNGIIVILISFNSHNSRWSYEKEKVKSLALGNKAQVSSQNAGITRFKS